MKKKGQLPQDGRGAGALVGILLVLIIAYIIFLPAEDREKLLEGNGDDKEGVIKEGDNITLLEESIGRIDYRKLDEFEHDIPSFTLFKTTNSEILKKINPFYIKSGWFDKKFYDTSFSIDEPELVDNALLSFTVTKNKGMLIIELNGNPIFEGEITGSNVEPIVLQKEMLQEDNILKFSVSKVGWKFWTTNEYAFQNIQITGDVTDVGRQESKNIFYATDTEIMNIEKAVLRFNPECNPNTVGTLEIDINKKNIFSGVPDCGILNKIEFTPGILDIGSNIVVFKTNQGTYLIDQIQVKTELEEEIFPIYYFEVNESVFEDIEDGDLEAWIQIEFVDDDKTKELDLNVNGHLTNIDQEKSFYERDITTWVEEGNNYIEIRPKTVLNIVEMRVVLFEVENND